MWESNLYPTIPPKTMLLKSFCKGVLYIPRWNPEGSTCKAQYHSVRVHMRAHESGKYYSTIQRQSLMRARARAHARVREW